MSGRMWFYHENSDSHVYLTWEEAAALPEALYEVDELLVPAAVQESEMAYLGLNQLPFFLYTDDMPPDPVYDACRLLGIGSWATSEFRGNMDFATALERKHPMKEWREAIKKAMEIEKRQQSARTIAAKARIALGSDDPYALRVMQLMIDLGKQLDPAAGL
ncbi:hypothetical protein Nazgul35 [Burkholderia phage BcepNazgul]|uniref:Uncharacterized protein n=1 Tax=Burkholderia phage BcepNazgul TaxID=242861 RepID=Q6UYK5_9CAUD|nr:hypothetical protein Nazgul35 [Burkholderia phage BcepNazgul]AAQ63336.2 hypothetical protein Nazgul35 [Burkholderia phage BcepNazgul]